MNQIYVILIQDKEGPNAFSRKFFDYRQDQMRKQVTAYISFDRMNKEETLSFVIYNNMREFLAELFP